MHILQRHTCKNLDNLHLRSDMYPRITSTPVSGATSTSLIFSTSDSCFTITVWSLRQNDFNTFRIALVFLLFSVSLLLLVPLHSRLEALLATLIAHSYGVWIGYVGLIAHGAYCGKVVRIGLLARRRIGRTFGLVRGHVGRVFPVNCAPERAKGRHGASYQQHMVFGSKSSLVR